jgi:hypothetical protein
MLTKTLKGFHRSVQQIGFLRDGTLFVDSHIFDNDRGDSAATSYLAAGDVGKLRTFLCRSGLAAQTDAGLLEVLAERFDDALEVETALHALGFRPVCIVDMDAHGSMPDVMPTAA